MKRHISRMHQNDNENEITDEIVQEVPQAVPEAEVTSMIPESVIEKIPNKKFANKTKEFKDMKDFLSNLELQQYEKLFEKEQIDMKILVQIRTDEIMDMIKDIGIKCLGSPIPN